MNITRCFTVLFLFICLWQASHTDDGLCGDNSLRNESLVCHEYLKMSKDGLLKDCEQQMLSCKGRCGNSDERKSGWKSCYCDSKCPSVGDCCIDHSILCNTSQALNATLKCIQYNTLEGYHHDNTLEGNVVTTECPSTWQNKRVVKWCLNQNSTDPLSILPVYDFDTKITFSNVYCAFCNGAKRFAYWGVKVLFGSSFSKKLLRNEPLSYLLKVLAWLPTPNSSFLNESCVRNPRLITVNGDKRSVNTSSYLLSLCKAYAMPVYRLFDNKMFKNAHCGRLSSVLLNVFGSHGHIFRCLARIGGSSAGFPGGGRPGLPSFSLIFTFPRSEYSRCKATAFLNPITKQCQQLGVRTGITTNTSCTLWITYNTTEYIMYHNGSVFVPSERRMYTDGSYKKINASILICGNKGLETMCLNCTLNKTVFQTNHTISSILTVVGSVVSLLSLLLFLLTHFLFRELRSSHGKNLMNMSCALLIFQSLFLASGKTDIQVVCDVITGVLHYTLLVMFAWMSVVSYDVSRRFASKVGRYARTKSKENRRFHWYCVYAWGTPLILVIVGLVLDISDAFEMGYGSDAKRRYCYLSPAGRIYFTAIPIGVLLLFNIVALVCTVAAIKKVQQDTKNIINHDHQPSLMVLCLKLTSVMGVTWMLGFVYAIADNPYVGYVYTVTNSLQGFFIFVCFGCSKQIRGLYRNKFACNKTIERRDARANHVGNSNKTSV